MFNVFHPTAPSFDAVNLYFRMFFKNVIREMTASKSSDASNEYFHVNSSKKSINADSQCLNFAPVNCANFSQFKTEYPGRAAGLPNFLVVTGIVLTCEKPVKSSIF